MTRSLWFGVVLPLVVAMAVGCSSGAPAPQQPPADASGSQAAPQSQQPTPQPGPAFGGLVQAGKQTSYKVTYRMTGTASGQSMSGEQTMYVKPPKTRMDISMPGQGDAMSMFLLEDGTYMCSSQGGRPSCLKMGAIPQPAQQDQGTQIRDKIQGNPDQYDTTPKGTRQLAGQQAQCYNIKPKGGAQSEFTEALFCFSSLGVPLLMQSKGPNLDMTMEATSYSATVSDSDFSLPAPTIEIPSIPGGIPGVPPGR